MLHISGAEPWVSAWGAAAPHQQGDDPFGFCVRQAAARDHDMHDRSSSESTVRPELPQHAPALQIRQNLPACLAQTHRWSSFDARSNSLHFQQIGWK